MRRAGEGGVRVGSAATYLELASVLSACNQSRQIETQHTPVLYSVAAAQRSTQPTAASERQVRRANEWTEAGALGGHASKTATCPMELTLMVSGTSPLTIR